MTFAGSSPALTRFEYSECLSAISPPQVKHLTGISISFFHLSVILTIIKTITVYTIVKILESLCVCLLFLRQGAFWKLDSHIFCILLLGVPLSWSRRYVY